MDCLSRPGLEVILAGVTASQPGAAAVGTTGAAGRSVRWYAPASLGLLFGGTLALAPVEGVRQLPYVAALFALPLLVALPSTRVALVRRRWLVLGAQGLLGVVPLFVFGPTWTPGVPFGLLIALVLLLLSGRASWLLAGALLVAEPVLRLTVTGAPWVAPTLLNVFAIPVYTIVTAAAFWVLVRLAQLVGQVERARRESADLAAMRERLAAAAALQAAVDHRLVDVAGTAAGARCMLATEPAEARKRVAAAASAAREAVARARALSYEGAAPSARGSVEVAPRQAAIGARLAWTVLVVTLLAEGLENSAYVLAQHDRLPITMTAIAAIVAVLLLQLHHSSPRWTGKPPAWPLTLTVQTALAFVGFLPWMHAYAGALASFAAGTVLLLVPGWRRWLWSTAIVVGFAALAVFELPRQFGFPDGQQLPYLINTTGLLARVTLMVYGSARLVALARQLEALQPVLTRLSAARERLRIARDVHDLLGLGLSAIALKSDLVTRLIDRGEITAAAGELAELERICAGARADIPAVTGDGPPLSLRSELATSHQLLSEAGITVRVEIDAQPLPPGLDAVLATVLREAVTNILRHASATGCTIELAANSGAVVFRVANDGLSADSATPTTPGIADVEPARGHGLSNLTRRVQDAGGHLSATRTTDRFVLTVQLPQTPIAGRVEPTKAIKAQPG